MDLYVENEHHDGYIRDNCLFREEIDIFDKMSAQVHYKNNVQLNYSLTTYSPFEGWRAAFNGTEGRLEAWTDIPYYKEMAVGQAEKHALELSQDAEDAMSFEPIIVHKLWNEHKTVQVGSERSGHGGGDGRLQDKIFRDPGATDPYGRTAGSRDGAMSVLIGIAARESIAQNRPINIADLTDLQPKAKRG
jgi:hypothetical protein